MIRFARNLFVAFSLLLSLSAHAAVTANSVVTAQTPDRGILQFLNASTPGTYATLYTAGANGSVCKAIWTDNSDGSATHLITLQIVNGGIKYGGVAITTVSSAGFANATPPQAMMSPSIWPGLPLDPNGNPLLMLLNGDTLQATFATTITAATQVDLHAICSSF